MEKLKGYQIREKIYESARTIIYRGYRERDNLSVLIKFTANPHPPLGDLINLRNHYTLTKSLDIPEIIQPLDLCNYGQSLVLIMPDEGLVSLEDYLPSNPISLADFLSIAIALAKILEKLISGRIIHKNINPSNILIHPKTKEIKLNDFSLASRLPKEKQEIIYPQKLEGNLAYLSPEQTGRMNRGIDYRTDFYSLGITYYQLLTGKIPFSSDDPLELVYCHLAKEAALIELLNPAVPTVLGNIIRKLMAKNAEDRYQSAIGLRADLEKCQQQYIATSKIDNFLIAQIDEIAQFNIPNRLYGREEPKKIILEAFKRVSQGSFELILVSGYSGVGKTALVSEVVKELTKHKGYFSLGKCDQFQKDIPLGTITRVFRGLVRQILGESEERLVYWRERFQNKLGQNAQLIINLIPELELIIGPQPSPPELGAIESAQLLGKTFNSFTEVFHSQEHPHVTFIDDMQWMDNTALHSLQSHMANKNNAYNLIIIAYRDNEVDANHPLIKTIEAIREQGSIIHEIKLQPLGIESITQLTADTLHTSPDGVYSLAKLLFDKTDGNPFFFSQLFKSLWQDKLIQFNGTTQQWHWYLSAIQERDISENVVDLMIEKLNKLDAKTLKVLQLAACVGNSFDLKTLAIVSEYSCGQTARYLWPALAEGLIIPMASNYRLPQVFEFQEVEKIIEQGELIIYRFLHDRVQQAAYTLIPLADKQTTHLKIGRLLIQNITEKEEIKDIFFLVNQLNQGRSLIENQSDKYQLAKLNFQAGKKAKIASAWLAAGEYFNIALSLIDLDSWQIDYEFTFNLYIYAVETEFLNTRFSEAETLINLILSQANILLDQIKVSELKIQMLTAKNQFLEAIELGLKTLEKLDISLIQPREENLKIQLPTLEELDKFPEMTAPKPLAAMRILELISAAAYFAKPEIFLQLSLTMVQLSLDYGNSLQSASAYIKYGIFLCGVQNDLEAGYHAGELALNLTQRQPMSASRCRVDLIFNLFICAWKKPVREAILGFQTTLQNSLSVGDLEDAASCAGNSCIYRFFAGEKLDRLVQEQGIFLEFLTKNQQGSFIYFARIWRQLSENLLGEVENSHRLSGDSFQEEVMLAYLLQANNHSALLCAYVAQEILSYLLGDFESAFIATQAAEKYAAAGTAWLVLALHKFYQALILLANYQPEYLPTIEANQEQIRLWATHAPSNFQHKCELITAEKYRVFGNKIEAIDAFERAIEAAQEQGYLHEEALGKELLAKLYLDWHKEKIARIYLQEAYDCYQNWSATAKVRELENKYNNHLNLSSSNNSENHLSSNSLDLATVIKAATILNSQVYINQLIVKLMEIVLENTGADKAVLILAEAQELEIVAITTINQEIFFCSRLIDDSCDVPSNIIRYTANAKSPIIINDIQQELFSQNEPYFTNHKLASALSIPLLKQGEILGIVYLENQNTKYAFSEQRIEILQLICSQAAISLENARLYQKLQDHSQILERTIAQRTQALEQEMQQRELTLKALRNSEQRYRLIVETAEEGVWMIDTENKTSFVNPKMAQILGYTSEEMLGRTLFEFMDEEGINLANYHIERRKQGISEQHDFKFQHRDGSDVWTLVSTNPMFSDEGEYLGSLAMITDITERRRNEEAVRISQQQMAAITANLPGAVFRFIYHADGSYSCPFASEGYVRLFGIDYQEFRKNPGLMLDFVHHEDRQKYLEAAAKAKTGNIDSFYGEVRFILPTGEEKWVATIAQLFRDGDGNVIVDGIDLDISERKEAEFALQRLNEELEQRIHQRTQELQNQAQLLETILQNMGDGVLVCDRNGEIILLNSVAEKFAGQNLPETGIESWSDFWGIRFPDGTPCPTEQLPLVRGLCGESIDGTEVIVYNPSYPNGLYLEVNVRPLKDESGTILGAVAVSRNIGDRKQVEAMLRQTNAELEKRVESRTLELKEAKEKAEAANKAKSTFLAHMSHELRTPLNAILGFSQLLTRQDSLTPSQREQLNIINRSGEHLLALINDILQFSKIEAGYVDFQSSSFNLPDLFLTLEQMFALKAASKGLILECHCCDHLTQYVSTDQGKLRQILINILGNAIKFTDRGSINMYVCQENRDNQTYLEIQITDTGIGIASEVIEKVFAPFLQVHAPSPNREGTGLGLAISRQFVELMGGNIAINSVIGEGTRVNITIPIEIAPIPQLSPINNSKQPRNLAPNQPDWRILVAEDQEDSRLFLTEMLTQIGFQVRFAKDGQEAVQLWQAWQPHLIWMDMRMPILDGLEATRQIRTLERENSLAPCKIIALTAHAFEEEKSHFLAIGCDDFLSKPVTETALLDKLSKHLKVIYLETELSEKAVPVSFQLNLEDLEIMSSQWLASFYQAILSLDSTLIFSLLEQIPPESKQLSDSIRFYVQEFDFDKLLAITKKAMDL